MLRELGFIGIFKVNPLIIGTLMFFSFLMVAFLVERVWYYLSHANWSEEFWKRLKASVQSGHIHEARTMCVQSNNVYAQVFATVLNSTHLDRKDNEELAQISRENQLERLRKRLGLFSTFSFISPLVGLLGTVTGIMQAFSDLGRSGSGGANIVAAGIAEALVATAAGILVAVPSALFYNFFTFKLRSIGLTMTNHAHELLILVYGGENSSRTTNPSASGDPRAKAIR
ncbi:MAG: MotA/TolQ/ExbB proton channel family protein [Elusimicrobiota bacterium]